MKHVLLLCLLLNALVAAAQNYWEELPAPPGGSPTQITQTANGWVYAEFYDKAMFYSEDNGLNWQQIFQPSSDPDSGFARITVGRAGTLFAERKVSANSTPPLFYDVYKSVDNGATWQLLLDSTNIHGLGETSTGTLFGLKDTTTWLQTVVRSENNGANWVTVKPLDAQWDYYYQVEIGGYDEVSVGFNDGAGATYGYYSHDNGATWKSKYITGVEESFFHTFSNTLLYKSSSSICRYDAAGTTTCFLIDSTISSNFNYVYSFYKLPDSSIYAATTRYRYKSVDDGITWQRIGPVDGMFNYLGDRPLSDGTWLATNSTTMGRSTDLGATWSFSAYGIRRGETFDFHLHTDQEWLAWSGNGLWYTPDAGQTWNLRRDKMGIVYGQHTQNMVSDADGNTWVVFGDSLLFTADMGQSFQNVTPPGGLVNYGTSKLGLNGAQTILFAGTPNGTMQTQDNGVTWQTTLDSLYLRKMMLHPSGVLLAIFDSLYPVGNSFYPYSMLYRSDDDGLTWNRTSNEIVEDIAVTPAGELFSLEYGQIRHSTDMGETWVSVQWAGDHLAADPSGFLFAFLPNNFANMSVDGGHTWQNLPAPPSLENVTSSIWFLAFDNQSRMYVRGWEYGGTGSRGHLFRTANPTSSGAWLTGTVFKDADGDCATHDPESPLENWIVRADGDDSWWATTDSTGHYSLFVDTGAYFLTVKPALALLWQTCADSLPVSLPNLLDTTVQDAPVLAVADCPYMTVQVAAPSLERCFESQVWVVCCNEGTENADSAWVDVTLDPALVFTDTTLNYEALGNNTFRFQLGAMPQGYCQNFMFRVYVDCDSTVLGQTTCIMAHVYPDSLCVEPAEWSGAEISVVARCEQDTLLRFDVTNTGPVPTQGLHYFVIEDDVVLMESNEIYQPNQTRTFSLPANGSFRRFESEQEPGHPFSMHVAAWAEGCGGFQNGGFPNMYFLNNGIPSQDVFCGELVGSFDPNDKQGFPLGYGEDHLVQPNTDIEYLVRFQNTGTAPARNVVVRDTLSKLLDPATLRMGPTSHPATWTLDGQGVLIVTFADINLPDSNANEAASHGFFSFNIAQQPDLSNGSVIHNTASIYFDFNSPIHTNKTRHQIGRDFITVAISDPTAPLTNVRVSPNPVTETALLRFEGLPESGAYRFVLLDALGKIRLDAPLNAGTCTLRREEFASGMYFFQVLDDKGKRAGAGKVLMQ